MSRRKSLLLAGVVTPGLILGPCAETVAAAEGVRLAQAAPGGDPREQEKRDKREQRPPAQPPHPAPPAQPPHPPAPPPHLPAPPPQIQAPPRAPALPPHPQTPAPIPQQAPPPFRAPVIPTPRPPAPPVAAPAGPHPLPGQAPQNHPPAPSAPPIPHAGPEGAPRAGAGAPPPAQNQPPRVQPPLGSPPATPGAAPIPVPVPHAGPEGAPRAGAGAPPPQGQPPQNQPPLGQAPQNHPPAPSASPIPHAGPEGAPRAGAGAPPPQGQPPQNQPPQNQPPLGLAPQNHPAAPGFLPGAGAPARGPLGAPPASGPGLQGQAPQGQAPQRQGPHGQGPQGLGPQGQGQAPQGLPPTPGGYSGAPSHVGFEGAPPPRGPRVSPAAAAAIGAAAGLVGGFVLSQPGAHRLDDIHGRRQQFEHDGVLVYQEPGRTIIRDGGGAFIRHDENERFRELGGNLRTERQGDHYVSFYARRDGGEVLTYTDANGVLLRRILRYPDGREIVLIDNGFRGPPRDYAEEAIVLPPPPVEIAPEAYVVDYGGADERLLYETLTAPPVARPPRRYTLDEVRYSPSLRAYTRSVDIDTINFDTGSWTVTPDQAQNLSLVAQALNAAIKRNPAEVFLIEGHTDAVGSDVDNLSLSDRRAQAVATILTRDFGVPPENLTTQGYGEQYLKVRTQGPARENRRVTVRRITPLINGPQAESERR